MCLIFSRFLILFIYIINVGYWQVLFITEEQLGKSYSVTSTFKCRGSTAAALVSPASFRFKTTIKNKTFLEYFFPRFSTPYVGP